MGVEEDRAQLRSVVYELARIKLQRECLLAYPRLTVLETRRVLLAFETAVVGTETACSQGEAFAHVDSFGTVLAHTIERLEHDPAQLRSAVYELALIKLQRERIRDQLTVPETRRLAFEAASDQIETPAVEPCADPLVIDQDNRIPSFLMIADRRVPRLVERSIKVRIRGWFHTRAWIRSGAMPLVKASILVVLAIAAVVILHRTWPNSQTQLPPPLELVQPSSAIQWPTAYGVYAVGDGQLQELERVPGRVSDQGVIMSMKPSRTTLLNGRVSFLVHRPDMAMGPTDRLEVRVFAKTRPTMWTIGNVVHWFRGVPVSEIPEMLAAAPESSDTVLAPGRYVLVIKGQPYDFTVAEPNTVR